MSRDHFDRASLPNASCMMVAGKRSGVFLAQPMAIRHQLPQTPPLDTLPIRPGKVGIPHGAHLFRVGTFLNFLRVPVGAKRPRKEKPLHQVEPSGEENHDSCDLPGQAHPRRDDAEDIAEDIRDVRPSDERADDHAGQGGGQEEPGSGPPRTVPRARNAIRLFPWT